MLIVPVIGDQIKTLNEQSFKVLGFSNYKIEGPAALVDDNGETGFVDFKDIVMIGKSKVHLVKNNDGYKVFSADGAVKRQFDLPQPGDTITADSKDYIVSKLSLGVKGKLASGLIIEAQDKDQGDTVELSLDQITNIEHMIFSRSHFLRVYADYREKGSTSKATS